MKVTTIIMGLGFALTLSACSGSSYSTPTSPSGSGGTTTGGTNTGGSGGTAQTITVVSQNGAQSFSPNPASLGGQMVVFRNADGIVHRVVLNNGSIDTGNIAPGATSAAVLMPASGGGYHCSIHPEMVGTVNPS